MTVKHYKGEITMEKVNNNKSLANELQKLSLKMDEAKNKMFFLHDVTADLETYALKFDKKEENSANWLAYEYSRICVPFMSLLSSVSDDITNTEKSIDELLEKLGE